MRRAFAACAAAARAWAPPALAGVSIASLRGSHAPLCGRGPTSGLGVRLLSSFTPGADTASEFEVKKSIFKASLAEAHSASAARAWVALNSDAKANHNCWACILPDMSRMSDDDGEPSGTAAKPILAALEQAQLGGAVLLVTRYRRGPKLGAGGLVRAYGAAARQQHKGRADAAGSGSDRGPPTRATGDARVQSN
ncbi:ribosomal protein S5 domain 2-type protein [Pelagophyceae sp. CCMP2097]|nr:ribosomal protein S5 domain 2-type protein [Pelagophyceae sp. CCMP2097]